MSWQNPFSTNITAVWDPQMFFGRKRELRDICSAIANRQCLSIVGTRRIGKSTLLWYVQTQMAEMQTQFRYDLHSSLLTLIDLHEYEHKTSEDFFTSVSTQILTQNRGQVVLARSPFGGADEFSSLLEQIKDQGLHLTLLMDSFHNVTHNKSFDLEFFNYLRSQASLGKVSYITASLAPLHEVCHHDIKSSPFFNIFGTCRLGPLTLEEAEMFVTMPAKAVGLPFTEAEVQWVIALAGRHPFLLQRVCYFLFKEKSLHPDQEADPEQVRDQSYHDLRPHFSSILERLSNADQERLRKEAQQRGSRQRGHLPEISESELFRQFLREASQWHAFQMTVEDMEKVLNNMKDLRLLGEGEMRYLKLVSRRTNNGTTSTATERGMAAREVLKEALERLRGTGSHNDQAEDWQSYNILYYRYFRHHLRHEQIAARLIVSARQYYRLRLKAIEALYNALMDMEVACS